MKKLLPNEEFAKLKKETPQTITRLSLLEHIKQLVISWKTRKKTVYDFIFWHSFRINDIREQSSKKRAAHKAKIYHKTKNK